MIRRLLDARLPLAMGLLGLMLALGIIIAAWIGADTIRAVKLANQTVSVKGYATQPITSDFAQWDATFCASGPTLQKAYGYLAYDRREVLTFLAKDGFKPSEVQTAAIDSDITYAKDAKGHPTNKVVSYDLSQSVHVQSNNVQRVDLASRQITSLIQQGIWVHSGDPAYLFTKLGPLKLNMLAKATANARKRAQLIASNSGGSLGPLREADQGVFQITAAHSTDVSSYGVSDTSSIDKTIKAVVTIDYTIH